jgi:hypothetical protein
MSHNAFFKKTAHIVAVPAIFAAIAASYIKPASATSITTVPTHETSQTLEAIELPTSIAPAELISRYATYSFRLSNGQSRSIYYFYASPSNVDYWEEDILGDDILHPDATIQVSVDDNRESCFYDFKAVFDNGAESTHYDINICELSSYTF